MAIVKPFQCIRPNRENASMVAELPYDVFSREEARKITQCNPQSFLNVDRADTKFPDDVDMYDLRVYEKARELLAGMIDSETLIRDSQECYYIYELTMDGRKQAGIVACVSIDDYGNGVVKKHENTREDKELDRIRHVDITKAQTGPIFLAYRSEEKINEIVKKASSRMPLYDFAREDKTIHRVWKVSDQKLIQEIEAMFLNISALYIADGHHRAASAVKAGLKRRKEVPGYTGKEPFNYVLSVLFPHDQLMILPYNRVVYGLNGLSKQEIMKKIEDGFVVTPMGKKAYVPVEKCCFGMELGGQWYELKAKAGILSEDLVDRLDVSVLQEYILCPILGIDDPRVDERIQFIGGNKGVTELEKRVGDKEAAAFTLYPTSMEELLSVADAGQLMPPKSTWFEPKLLSGLFIHEID